MVKLYTKKENSKEKPGILASKKFNLKLEDIEFAIADKFLFSTLFILAISNKKAYLFSEDNKKPEVFDSRDIEKIVIEKKTDLNLFIKGGRVVNLTSVVGASPKVVNFIKHINEELNRVK